MTSTKILYIGGQTRSGSTLIARLMGEMDGFVNCGELTHFWRPFLQNTLCGCGLPFDACPFWTNITTTGFGRKSSIDADLLLRTKHMFERPRSVLQLLNPFRVHPMPEEFVTYVDFLRNLYQSILSVSGGRVVVDSSKSSRYLETLADLEDTDLRVLHLVRDSRAVAYSWQRRRPDGCPEVSPIRLAWDWNVQNIATEIVGKRLGKERYLRMLYEDAVADPVFALKSICEFMSEPISSLDFLNAPLLQIPVHHTVNGNPDRFKTEFFIRADNEWKEHMDKKQQNAVLRVSRWLMRRYGYG